MQNKLCKLNNLICIITYNHLFQIITLNIFYYNYTFNRKFLRSNYAVPYCIFLSSSVFGSPSGLAFSFNRKDKPATVTYSPLGDSFLLSILMRLPCIIYTLLNSDC